MLKDNKEAKFKGCKTKIRVVRAVWWEEARNIQSPLNPINYSCSVAKSVTGFFIFFSSFLPSWATNSNILKASNNITRPHLLATKVDTVAHLLSKDIISPRRFISIAPYSKSVWMYLKADFVLLYSPPPQTIVVQQPHQQNSAADDCCCAW